MRVIEKTRATVLELASQQRAPKKTVLPSQQFPISLSISGDNLLQNQNIISSEHDLTSCFLDF